MSTPAKNNNGTGLEDVNIPGQAYLREALTSCTDPLKAIESFQVCLRCTEKWAPKVRWAYLSKYHLPF